MKSVLTSVAAPVCTTRSSFGESPGHPLAVVGTPAMAIAPANWQANRLMFFSDIHEAADWLETSNSCTERRHPILLRMQLRLSELCTTRPATMVWHRVPISGRRDRARGKDIIPQRQRPGRIADGEGQARQVREELIRRLHLSPHTRATASPSAKRRSARAWDPAVSLH